MQPESAVISAGSTVQAIGLALLVVMVIFLGYKLATGGAKGFAFVASEIGGLVAAVLFIARPNDMLSMLLKFVGGVQAVSLPK